MRVLWAVAGAGLAGYMMAEYIRQFPAATVQIVAENSSVVTPAIAAVPHQTDAAAARLQAATVQPRMVRTVPISSTDPASLPSRSTLPALDPAQTAANEAARDAGFRSRWWPNEMRARGVPGEITSWVLASPLPGTAYASIEPPQRAAAFDAIAAASQPTPVAPKPAAQPAQQVASVEPPADAAVAETRGLPDAPAAAVAATETPAEAATPAPAAATPAETAAPVATPAEPAAVIPTLSPAPRPAPKTKRAQKLPKPPGQVASAAPVPTAAAPAATGGSPALLCPNSSCGSRLLLLGIGW